MPRLLTPSDYRRMPWKNGGGETQEIAVDPEGADLATFAWRASLADIAGDGAFSEFPGVDRTLVLLAGAGMHLEGAAGTLDVTAPFKLVAFAGEARLDCRLVRGPARDFNLMVRRGVATGAVSVVRDALRMPGPADARLCFAAQGSWVCVLTGLPPMELQPGHTVVVPAADRRADLELRPIAAGAVAVVAVMSYLPATPLQ
jgi:environmental stress-induced protein Ves